MEALMDIIDELVQKYGIEQGDVDNLVNAISAAFDGGEVEAQPEDEPEE